jgi:hypothetical protein
VNPFLQQIIGTIVRAAILWLAAKFGATLSEDELVKLTAQAVPIVAVVGWSLWQKYRGRQKLLTALATTGVRTEHEIEAAVSDGNAPAVTTAKDAVPV